MVKDFETVVPMRKSVMERLIQEAKQSGRAEVFKEINDKLDNLDKFDFNIWLLEFLIKEDKRLK